MNRQSKEFLVGTLGAIGAKAILKALERAPELESAIIPRTALSWATLIAKAEIPGNIPGLDAKLSLKKTEKGYSGNISLEQPFDFEDDSLTHIAAALSVALDFSYKKEDPKAIDLARLGKSIDLLVKTNFVDQVRALQKIEINNAPVMQILSPHVPEKGKATNVISNPAGTLNGQPVFHHIYLGASGHGSVVHSISTSSDPHDKVAALGTIHGIESPVQEIKRGDGIGSAPWGDGTAFSVGRSAVRSDARNQGVGHLLYSKALQHHGRMVSDSYVSSGASKVWGKLLGSPGASGALGKVGDPSDVHWAESSLGKGEKSAVAAPQAPGAPSAPQAPSRRQPSLKSPKIPKPSLPKIQKSSDGDWICSTCGGKNSINNGRLLSCLCWRDLADDVKLAKSDSGYEISFGKKWDKDSFDLWVSELRFNL